MSSHADLAESEEQGFIQQFEERVLDLVRQIDRQFPYKQSVIWSIEYGTDKEHSIHIMKSERRSQQ